MFLKKEAKAKNGTEYNFFPFLGITSFLGGQGRTWDAPVGPGSSEKARGKIKVDTGT